MIINGGNMSKPDRSIDPRILESAKKEFLDKGFLGASLNNICRKAGVTTGALYKRFKGKEELFSALVDDAVDALKKVREEKAALRDDITDEELWKAWNMDEGYMMWWFRFLYDRIDAMRLLLSSSEGTKYSHFEHEWVESMCQSTYAYYLKARDRGLVENEISEEEMHVMLSSFWMTIYEPIVHYFEWDELESLCSHICNLFNWHRMLGFRRPE